MINVPEGVHVPGNFRNMICGWAWIENDPEALKK